MKNNPRIYIILFVTAHRLEQDERPGKYSRSLLPGSADLINCGYHLNQHLQFATHKKANSRRMAQKLLWLPWPA